MSCNLSTTHTSPVHLLALTPFCSTGRGCPQSQQFLHYLSQPINLMILPFHTLLHPNPKGRRSGLLEQADFSSSSVKTCDRCQASHHHHHHRRRLRSVRGDLLLLSRRPRVDIKSPVSSEQKAATSSKRIKDLETMHSCFCLVKKCQMSTICLSNVPLILRCLTDIHPE